MEILLDKLKKYAQSDYYGFHMPGAKREATWVKTGLPYDLDITEITGFDDLHHPTGLLLEMTKKATKLFAPDLKGVRSAISVGGSTAGILAALLACTQKGDEVLMARNCHKSVYHGVFLQELRPIYIYPKLDTSSDILKPISVNAVAKCLEENPQIKVVVITSPTYEGVVSDIKSLAALTKEKGIPLIVDEAHGAHLPFHTSFPPSALLEGADLVVNSLHKTLPALTQTALLHGQGERIDWDKVLFYLQLFQSSSPSYILLASVDVCLQFLKTVAEVAFDGFVADLKKLRRELVDLKHLKLIPDNDDISKLIISTKDTNISGMELFTILHKRYQLELELANHSYVLALASVSDTKEGFARLNAALKEVDASLEVSPTLSEKKQLVYFPALKICYNIADIFRLPKEAKEKKPLRKSMGSIGAEYVYLYPPGIPLLVPGEEISMELVELLLAYEDRGYTLSGVEHGEILTLK